MIGLVVALVACGGGPRSSNAIHSEEEVKAAFADSGEPLKVWSGQIAAQDHNLQGIYAARDPADRTTLTVFVYRQAYPTASKRSVCDSAPPCRIEQELDNLRVFYSLTDPAAVRRIEQALDRLRQT
jgi:hypothetical protein